MSANPTGAKGCYVGCTAVQFELNGGEPVGMSIPATEHSVMTAWPSERAAIKNMIAHFGAGLFACVMDSYDYAKVRACRTARHAEHADRAGSPTRMPCTIE